MYAYEVHIIGIYHRVSPFLTQYNYAWIIISSTLTLSKWAMSCALKSTQDSDTVKIWL